MDKYLDKLPHEVYKFYVTQKQNALLKYMFITFLITVSENLTETSLQKGGFIVVHSL